jgi:hypothetical protein
MKQAPWHTMLFDNKQDRWIVIIQERGYALHCGESFRIRMGTQSVLCRLEMDYTWYVIMGDCYTCFDLKEKKEYYIQLQ